MLNLFPKKLVKEPANTRNTPRRLGIKQESDIVDKVNSATGLFTTPFWYLQAQEKNAPIIKESFSWALKVEKEIPSGKKSNRGGYQSRSWDEWDLPFHELLKEQFKFLPNVRYLNWWVNINRKGDYNLKHTHPGCDLSGVLYLTTNYNSFHIQDPMYHTRQEWYDVMKLPVTHQWDCQPGDILLFPSDCEHFVDAHKHEEPRISISFNLKIDPWKI